MQKSDYVLGYDWIQFTSIGELPRIKELYQATEDVVLNPRQYSTRHYQVICDVLYKGQEVAELEYLPHSSVMNPHNVMIKMTNVVCYEQRISELIGEIHSALGLQFNNWTRLDFCLDGYGLMKPLQKAFQTQLMGKDDSSAEIRLVGKSNMIAYTSPEGVKGIRVGSRASNKSCLGYNKSLELKLSRKHHIEHWWKENNLDTSKGDVERLEITLKGPELQRYDLFNPKKHSDPVQVLDYLRSSADMFEDFFLSACKKIYEFICVNAERADTAARLYCLELRNVGKNLIRKASRVAASELYRMKQAAKTVFWLFEATGKKFYKQLSEDIASMIYSEKWHAEKRPHWREEFRLRNCKERFQFITRLEDHPEYTQMEFLELDAAHLKIRREARV